MPHVREAVSAVHDDHDALLVAALAAGDLTGTDRDQALALIDSCSDCAALHADLVAIARATATLPPPIASSGRDFRLTPAQAAGLRRSGWRRFLPAGGSVPLSRPLGVALATFGIAGLLIGTQPLSFVGSSGASASTPAPAAAQALTGAGAAASVANLAPEAAPSAAASAAGAPVPAAASAGASMGSGTSSDFGSEASAAASAAVADNASKAPVRAASGGGTAAGGVLGAGPAAPNQSAGGVPPSAPANDVLAGTGSSTTSSWSSPLVLLSLAVFLVGVVLFVSSYRGRRTSL
jgi:hypothetical protein